MKNKLIIFGLSSLVYIFNISGMQPTIVLPENFTEVDRIRQPDRKTLVVGTRNFYGTDTLVLARYNTNNQLDTDFGREGLTFFFSENGSIYPLSIILQSDGKILVKSLINNQEVLTRFNSDGSFDQTFGIVRPSKEQLL